ncbi:hypothetical protein OPAG_05247 [Rhodococcus opacus PD630]|jgi:hypothetical protein|nr:hypothetical protein Pd630_LPD04711 [Rhodococcus opacus PD630]EHI45216.1 hypothetical protein OPAG_05247 [Rhodococcus opacus PD630]
MYACIARTRNVMIASASSEILKKRNTEEIFGHRFKKRREQSADEHRPDPASPR